MRLLNILLEHLWPWGASDLKCFWLGVLLTLEKSFWPWISSGLGAHQTLGESLALELTRLWRRVLLWKRAYGFGAGPLTLDHLWPQRRVLTQRRVWSWSTFEIGGSFWNWRKLLTLEKSFCPWNEHLTLRVSDAGALLASDTGGSLISEESLTLEHYCLWSTTGLRREHLLTLEDASDLGVWPQECLWFCFTLGERPILQCLWILRVLLALLLAHLSLGVPLSWVCLCSLWNHGIQRTICEWNSRYPVSGFVYCLAGILSVLL